MSKRFSFARVHHAEDMFAWRDPQADNQMHWVTDVALKPTPVNDADEHTEVIDNILEDVYQDTNSINHHWSENESILFCKKAFDGRHRSTSVGDTITLWTIDDGKQEYHSKWRVASFGFDMIDATSSRDITIKEQWENKVSQLGRKNNEIL